MELLAGDDDMMATVLEHGFTYRFDYSKVYWNSRLDNEHHRLVTLMEPGQIVCDMFAGVGPFAVPAAAKKCVVHANDLNPHSYEALIANATRNKVSSFVHPYNMDGRDFVRELIKKDVLIDHVIMNLPASAIEFLDVFYHAYPTLPERLPTIHCYCFSKADDPEKESMDAIQEILKIRSLSATIHHVRLVAPKKEMLCVSFLLPESVAVASSTHTEDANPPPTKQLRTE
eukprot:c6615_g1_i2.p1 GENE.c6615_g1_i2~~c6615_g1_i2.p1  ORF type:complete len:229 (-),score=80.17 c6615_g1_i2:16-702(-)